MARSTTPVQCRICGQEWPMNPYWLVPCRNCGADVGSPCKRPSEHTCTTHTERMHDAVLAGHVEKYCPDADEETKRAVDAYWLRHSGHRPPSPPPTPPPTPLISLPSASDAMDNPRKPIGSIYHIELVPGFGYQPPTALRRARGKMHIRIAGRFEGVTLRHELTVEEAWKVYELADVHWFDRLDDAVAWTRRAIKTVRYHTPLFVAWVD